MTDTLGVGPMLPECGTDKTAFNLDNLDLDIMDSTNLDNLIEEELNGTGLGLNDADIDKLMNPDDLNIEDLGASERSLDNLVSMPIVEVEDKYVQAHLGNLVKSRGSSMTGNNKQPQRNRGTQPGYSSMGSNFSQNSVMQNGSNMMHQQGMHGQNHGGGQDDALQRMLDDAVVNHDSNSDSMMSGGMSSQPVLSQQRLQEEKMKLLNKLNEINQRQNRTMPMNMQGNSTNGFLEQQQRQQLQQQQQQQHTNGMSPMNAFLVQQQSNRSNVASIGGIGSTGETPLTSFLRKGQKSQAPSTSMTEPATGGSMLSMQVSGAPKAASIFSERPMDIDLRQSKLSSNQILAKTGLNPNLVRKLSARNLMARSDSSQNVTRNAAWGTNGSSSFKTSGILPKHVSETHLLRASKGGMVRSRSKANSMSRENLLYSQMKKSSSKNQMQRDDSLGQLLPIKRRPVGGAKHKLGMSSSVPHMRMGVGVQQQGGLPDSRRNAMW